jgi:hypothetical protein
MGEANTDGMMEWQASYAALDKEGKKLIERETRLVIECMQVENKSRLEIGQAQEEADAATGARNTRVRTEATWDRRQQCGEDGDCSGGEAYYSIKNSIPMPGNRPVTVKLENRRRKAGA